MLSLSLSWSTANATETILKKDKPAPFDGVLVSEKQYRTYVANEFEVKDLRKNVAMVDIQLDGLLKRETEAKRDEPNVWTYFLSGIILGAAGVFAARGSK